MRIMDEKMQTTIMGWVLGLTLSNPCLLRSFSDEEELLQQRGRGPGFRVQGLGFNPKP